MSFKNGFNKEAAKAPKALSLGGKARALGQDLLQHAGKGAKAVGSHLKNNRKDYLMGGAAAGTLGTAYGVNKRSKK